MGKQQQYSTASDGWLTRKSRYGMRVRVRFTNISAERLWALAGTRFHDVGGWTRAVQRSASVAHIGDVPLFDDSAEHRAAKTRAPQCNDVRMCDVGFLGHVWETLVEVPVPVVVAVAVVVVVVVHQFAVFD